MKFFNKILILVTVLCLMFATVACTGSNKEENESENYNENVVETPVEEEEDDSDAETEEEEEGDWEDEEMYEDDSDETFLSTFYSSDFFSVSAELPCADNVFLVSDPLYFYITNHSDSQVEVSAIVEYPGYDELWDIEGLVVEPGEQVEFSSYIDEDKRIYDATISLKVSTENGLIEHTETFNFKESPNVID